MCMIRELLGSENKKKHCLNDIQCASVISLNTQRYEQTNKKKTNTSKFYDIVELQRGQIN